MILAPGNGPLTGSETIGTVVYLTLTGHYGWSCEDCGAESRFVYVHKSKARRLGLAHERYCRGRPIEKEEK